MLNFVAAKKPQLQEFHILLIQIDRHCVSLHLSSNILCQYAGLI